MLRHPAHVAEATAGRHRMIRTYAGAMAEGDEPDDDRDPLDEIFGPDQDDERPPAAPSWLGALGQMSGAAIAVLAVVVALILSAVVLRRLLWP